MPAYLIESDFTFTRDRLEDILGRDQKAPLSLDSWGLPLRLIHHSEFLEERQHLTPEWRELHLPRATEPFAVWLLGQETQSAGESEHLGLDRANEALVDWAFVKPSLTAADTPLNHAAVTEGACNILGRLPSTPPQFHGTMHMAWEEESVSIDRVADAINNVLRCFDSTSNFADNTSRTGLFLMRAFLWAAWHRLTMLHHHYRLGMQLRNPESVILSPRTGIVGARAMKNLATTESAAGGVPPYMCRWAFNLVFQDQTSMPPDSRALRERFARVFSHKGPRCLELQPGQHEQCQGESPAKCMRFKGAVIKDQSSHEGSCKGGCRKLTWDEASFRSLPSDKGHAVSLADTDGMRIRYTPAGPKTMAISHAWSHGQGGRPEMYADATGGMSYKGGYNICLHRRFERVARGLGCESYWMDTPCIPQDHILRREEITHINDVFLGSKVTLVCDRDIMSMDLNAPTLEMMESVLATVLVCDWNVRA